VHLRRFEFTCTSNVLDDLLIDIDANYRNERIEQREQRMKAVACATTVAAVFQLSQGQAVRPNCT